MIVITRIRSRAKLTAYIGNLPTPKEIRTLTAEIRKSWSPRERRRRCGNIRRSVELLQMPLQPRRKGFWIE